MKLRKYICYRDCEHRARKRESQDENVFPKVEVSLRKYNSHLQY